MRKIPSLVLMVSVAAVLTIVIASTAHAVTLCKENEATCSAGNSYPVPTTLELRLPKNSDISFAGTPSATCGFSTGTAETTAAGTPLLGEGTGLSFTSCTSTCSVVEARHLPWALEIEATSKGNGTITVKSGGSGNPGFKLTKCLSGAVCAYGIAEATGEVKGGAPATVSFSFSLKREEGEPLLCSATNTVTGTYAVVSPTESIFIEPFP